MLSVNMLGLDVLQNDNLDDTGFVETNVPSPIGGGLGRGELGEDTNSPHPSPLLEGEGANNIVANAPINRNAEHDYARRNRVEHQFWKRCDCLARRRKTDH